MRSQVVVRALLASPGDSAQERSCVAEVIQELNDTWADYIGLRLDLITWETHTWPAAGTDGQGVINTQFADDYEIFIGVIRERLGTPTPRAASGTVEEFERAYRRRQLVGVPEIMFYLRRTSDTLPEVARFKQQLESLGV